MIDCFEAFICEGGGTLAVLNVTARACCYRGLEWPKHVFDASVFLLCHYNHFLFYQGTERRPMENEQQERKEIVRKEFT